MHEPNPSLHNVVVELEHAVIPGLEVVDLVVPHVVAHVARVVPLGLVELDGGSCARPGRRGGRERVRAPLCVAVRVRGQGLVQVVDLGAAPRARVQQMREVEEQRRAAEVGDNVAELEALPLESAGPWVYARGAWPGRTR
jgi:hypothetical protein